MREHKKASEIARMAFTHYISALRVASSDEITVSWKSRHLLLGTNAALINYRCKL